MSDQSQMGGGPPGSSFWGSIQPPPDAVPQNPPQTDTVIQPISDVQPTADIWWPQAQPERRSEETLVTPMDVPTNPGPPWLWLGLALACPLIIGVASLIWASTWMYAVAWAVVCAAGFGFLMVFTSLDITSRSSNSYVARDEIVAPLRIAIIVVTLVFSMWNAWLFADWFARLPIFMGMG